MGGTTIAVSGLCVERVCGIQNEQSSISAAFGNCLLHVCLALFSLSRSYERDQYHIITVLWCHYEVAHWKMGTLANSDAMLIITHNVKVSHSMTLQESRKKNTSQDGIKTHTIQKSTKLKVPQLMVIAKDVANSWLPKKL